MSIQRQRRRGTQANNQAFTGAQGEFVYLTDRQRVAVHDGATLGGFELPNVRDIQNNTHKFGTVGGTANAITLAYNVPRTAHTNGAEIIFRPTANNTTAVTVAVDSIAGTKAIEKMVSGTSTALAADDLRNGVVARAIYDGTRYQLQTGGGSLVSVKQQLFTASGTYTPSAGMLFCIVEIVGGGGGAGTYSASGAAIGGAAGGYCRKLYTAAAIGASVTVTCGTGGAVDTAGGNTTFLSMTANGGEAGQSGSGSLKRGAKGGTATGGDINRRGDNSPPNHATASSAGTIGGSSMLGVGGDNGTNGTAGTLGSGGGAATNGTSAAGGVGAVYITEFCSQ